MILLIILLLSVFTCSEALAATQEQIDQATSVDACSRSSKNTEIEYISFDYPQRTIILPGYIQDKPDIRQSANFILDTGGNRTILDQRTANALRLKSVGETTLVAPSGTLKSHLVEIDGFCVGRRESARLVAAVQDLSIYSRAYKTAITAMLGNDFLKRFIVHINYTTKHAAFMDSATKVPGLHPVATVPFRIEKDLILVEATFPGGLHTPLIVDTGHHLDVQLYPDSASNLQLQGPISERRIGSASESHLVTVGQIAWIELGTHKIESVSINIHPVVTPNSFNTKFKPGLLGNGVLERFIVEIDYPAAVLRLYDSAKVSQ